MSLISLSYSLLLILGVAGLLEIGLRTLQLFLAFGRGCDVAGAAIPESATSATFVSVHVPTCNEPPALVIATLRCLAQSRFRDFEVIVLDNNTPDPSIWTPVAQEVERLGSRFRFIHIARLAGAKAGALNVALAAADARTTHVAIVDADYQVDPGFLGDAITAAQAAGVDYVQFPQAYRGVGREARGVECELGDYFACFAVGAGRPGSMLPTGTLSLFSAAALRAVGGWPTSTITEDAEIGVRLQAAGYRGQWLARNVGRGLLPVDLPGIRKQRARWSAGNFQVLKGQLLTRSAASGCKPGLRDQLYLIGQLTAWMTLVLPAAASLIIVPLLPQLPFRATIASLAAATILLSASLTACRIILAGDDRSNLMARLEAIVTKLALTWTSATAWIAALFPRRLHFHRTPKIAGIAGSDHDTPTLAISLLFVASTAAYWVAGAIGPALACGLLAAVWPCGRFVDRSLRLAAIRNPELGQ
jgi:hypothetical protein